jgi:hypothetical protein
MNLNKKKRLIEKEKTKKKQRKKQRKNKAKQSTIPMNSALQGGVQ